MTEQEAIKILQINCTCSPKATEFIKASNIAIKALEKQIPKKPTDVCTPVITWGLCPVCKGKLNMLGGQPNKVFKSNNFCPDCGQALDWSDEE